MVIISDANVIVYFWKANLLEKILHSVEFTIPEAIFIELTQNRIRASYPDLSKLIIEYRYNRRRQGLIKIEEIVHEREETLALHEYIKAESGLDSGEIDGIMLSIFKGLEFVTNDSDAIEFFNESLEHNSKGVARGINEFLNTLRAMNIINEKEIRLIIEAMK